MIISSHYNLKSVRLIDCPPLGNLQIDFDSEMTIICGENGSGKSSLTSALVNKKWPLGGIFELEDEGDRGSFLKFIRIYLLDNEPYRALDGAKVESHWLTLAEKYPEILRIASTKLCQLLRPKLGKWKFFRFLIVVIKHFKFCLTVSTGH